MNRKFSALILATVLALGTSVFAESPEEAEARCKQYAQEDNVSAEEMEDYMAECVKQLIEESSDDTSQEKD